MGKSSKNPRKIAKKREAEAAPKQESLLDAVRNGLFAGKGKAWALEIPPLMEEAINDMEEIQNTHNTIAVAFGAEAANNYLQENMGWTVEILQQTLNEYKKNAKVLKAHVKVDEALLKAFDKNLNFKDDDDAGAGAGGAGAGAGGRGGSSLTA